MQNITLNKIAGESYNARNFKMYEVKHGGEIVGTIAQDLWNNWKVVTADFQRVSHHSTIKAAVRVAARAL